MIIRSRPRRFAQSESTWPAVSRHATKQGGEPAKNHREDQHDSQQREQHLHDHGKNPAPVGVALGGGIALRHHDGLPHGEQAQSEHLQRHLRQNLQRVPDRSAARRQNLASSGLPNRQRVHMLHIAGRANNLRFRLITVSHMSNIARFLHLARSCSRRNSKKIQHRLRRR